MTIVSIRGTHGSGKSSIVKTIIERYKAAECLLPPDVRGKQKPYGYIATLHEVGQLLFVVGPYTTACGGCDAVQPYSNILTFIQAASEKGMHVLFEGALVSSSYGTIGAWMGENLKKDPVFAFLDTPLEECLARIARRRAAKGNFEPVNPKNTAVKFDNVARTKDQMDRLGSGVRIVDIDHRQPVRQVLKLFGVNLRKEPQ